MNKDETTIDTQRIREMFARIAPRYDLLNRLMTFGRDRAWRKRTVQVLDLKNPVRLLDVGAGTGVLAEEALTQNPKVAIFACDFSREMLAVGREHLHGKRIHWILAHAQHLPFKEHSFDAVFSGFLLRNVGLRQQVLDEQFRVTAESGMAACIDTSPPPPGILQPLLRFYLRRVIPFLGRVFAGDVRAYRYLSHTTEEFLPPTKLAEHMRKAGFEGVTFVRAMLGVIAIHWGRKPPHPPESPSA